MSGHKKAKVDRMRRTEKESGRKLVMNRVEKAILVKLDYTHLF